MIRPLLLLLLLGFMAEPAIAQWQQQGPLPTGRAFSDLAFPTPTDGFIVGSNSQWDDVGALHVTRDGGTTWSHPGFPDEDPLSVVYFLNEQLGWVAGNDAYRTTDGGHTWHPLPYLGTTYAMRFFTPDFGYAITNGGSYVSHNGGLSWSSSPHGMYAFDFRDDQVGLGVSAGGVYRTDDGGQTFTQVHNGSATAVLFLTDQTALALTGGDLLRSTDAGQTWTDVADASNRTSLVRLSDEVAFAFVSSAQSPAPIQLLRTDDGGQSWDPADTAFGDGVSSITRLDAATAVAVTPTAAVWRTADAGQTWTETFTPPFIGYGSYSVSFPTAEIGYLAYGYGLLYKTTDGGLTWGQVNNGYGEDLYDMVKLTDEHLIAVGFNGTVLVTENAGAKWFLVEDGMELWHHNIAIDHVGTDFVALVTDEGTVITSADGGWTWSVAGEIPLQASVFTAYDVAFSSPEEGWVVGHHTEPPYTRTIWRTTDGGATWTDPVPSAHIVMGVDVEGDHVWAITNSFYLSHSSDGGQTWTQGVIPQGPVNSVSDIEFFDESTGYVVAGHGYAARSTDGGATWSVLPTSNTHGLSDLSLSSPDDVWVSTTDDRVYHSTNGGQTWEVTEIEAEPLASGSFSAVAATEDGVAWAAGFKGHIYTLGGPEGIVGIDEPPVAVEPVAESGGTARAAAYPNPFAGRATLELVVSAPQHVTVEAYDVLGRRVALLHAGPLPAGTHEVAFDGGDLPGGVYVLRAQGEAFSTAQQVTLVR